MTPTTLLTFENTTQSITDWALDYGIPPEVIINRIKKNWPICFAITEPIPTRPGKKLTDRFTAAAISALDLPTIRKPKRRQIQERDI